ncbi:MAG TPA: hypothetical protein VLA45_15440, partial [Paracoccaceae bacterium]|nr:hypothetical protein [Paracoccaceae bacterium]
MYLMLLVLLAVWMLGCGYAGYARRFGLFAVILCGGIALNTAWMVLGLQAHPLEGAAVIAHAAAVMYGLGALGTGWLIGR